MNTCKIKIKSSRYDYFKNNDIINIKFIYLIDEGSYGIIILLNKNKYVIKLFKENYKKNYGIINTDEYELFNELIKINNNDYCKNLVYAIATGHLNENLIINNIKFSKNNKLIIMPFYESFHKINPYFKVNSILYYQDYKYFILNFIYKILNAIIFLKNKLDIIHIDIKLNNILYNNNELILIDLGLNIHKCNEIKIFNTITNYKYWPDKKCIVGNIPIYGLAICILKLINNYNNYLHNLNLITDTSIKLLLSKMVNLEFTPDSLLLYLKTNFKDYLVIQNKNKNKNKNKLIHYLCSGFI